jgi:hypothetical protein
MDLHYHVVIITAADGIISRHAGTDYPAALQQAKGRRQDFPDAKEVRVVHPQEGVLAVL